MAEHEEQDTRPADEAAEGQAEASSTTDGSAEAAAPSAAEAGDGGGDPWSAFDAVLERFGTDLPVGVGTLYGEDLATVTGRFAGWANQSGWPCTVRLVREAREDTVVVLVEGPPLAGGRPRAIPLGAFPATFEQDALRAVLEYAFVIGESWGPRDEPAPTAAAEPPPAAESADSTDA